MTRWAPDAALRLEAAALDLVAEQGYAATTVPQITHRAGLTTRTFFRHFADKRDVFFLRDREFPRVVAAALEGLPAETAPLAALQQGLERATSPLAQWREPILRRRAVIRAEDQLRERELLKSGHLADAIAEALVARSRPGTEVTPAEARLLASVAVLVFDRALDSWLDGPPLSPLSAHLADAWRDLAALFGP
ncbi:TetR/AcrR family transcriptional regulator [Herbiconiux sp. CPCC 205716]|uniref:TetR/AcrR family transcriptional regulator n=1 Tax=Herbiconiux gentiana TaxID=2970912 RepID=A0ABT2GAR5_9MICO|nr:TetR/AcrR family transcriptional regulator [Herbiconiux gentiana]MCS5713293.1 TetR/AcrR family transcriptional regulator [Herbiconiux gentiana]